MPPPHDQKDAANGDKVVPLALMPMADAEMADLFRVLAEDGPAMRRRVRGDVMLMDYPDYLKSALWKRIKKRVLERDNKTCQCCGGRGSVVHHRSYERDVMEGRNDALLATICNGCHNIIHFTDSGEPRSTAEADVVFLAGQRQPNIPPVGKIDLRSPKINYPGDTTRVTSLQMRLFVEAFHAAWRHQTAARKSMVENAAARRTAKLAAAGGGSPKPPA
ncbi:MAG TPA: HNH endonuclease signature motif containing protein [Variovorax sp.]|nr:HNH endonuclease signature motif containing protein [Variovorax sp.]